MAEISPLRRRMIEDVTIRNLSPATQRSYIHAVSKFSRHFGRSPDRLGLGDVRAFQVHLVSTGISWPSLNQIVCALRFFYGVTLRQDTIPERITYAREPRKLPVVLIADDGLCRRIARLGSGRRQGRRYRQPTRATSCSSPDSWKGFSCSRGRSFLGLSGTASARPDTYSQALAELPVLPKTLGRGRFGMEPTAIWGMSA
jgi:hypothetical protein